MAYRRRVVVIGLGRFGTAAATALYEVGHDVLAVDVNHRRIQEIKDQVTHALQADATDPQVLNELGVRDFDAAIVALSSDLERSILVTVQLKQMGVPYVIAKAQTALHGDVLEKVGADRVVFPEREAGIQIAHSFTVPNVVDYMAIGPEYGISKLEPPADLIGRTVGEVDLPTRCGVTLLLIERGLRVILNPGSSDTIQAGDLIVVAGKDEDMERLRSRPNPRRWRSDAPFPTREGGA